MEWPKGADVKITESIRNWPPQKPGDKIEYLCSVSFPAPERAGIRRLYISGRGWQESTWFAHGYGDTKLAAEDAAWAKYQEIVNCGHDIQPIAHVDLPDGEPLTYLLDGDATCTKCQTYLPFYFMDDGLHRCMNLAHRAHENQRRKYGGDRHYIEHPREVYNRVAFWQPKTPTERRVRMGKAAWLHDVKEDCQDKDSNPYISDAELIEAAGEDAFKLICELTNPSKGVKAPRAVRKQMDRDHLKVVSEDAKIIKMIDRICNLNDMGGCPDNDFLKLYAYESRQLWEVIHDADPKLARELLAVIEAVERRANGIAP